MSLPDKSKLKSIYQAGKKDSSLGLPTDGWFWSSSEDGADGAYGVNFSIGYTGYGSKDCSYCRVLCVGD